MLFGTLYGFTYFILREKSLRVVFYLHLHKLYRIHRKLFREQLSCKSYKINYITLCIYIGVIDLITHSFWTWYKRRRELKTCFTTKYEVAKVVLTECVVYINPSVKRKYINWVNWACPDHTFNFFWQKYFRGRWSSVSSEG